VETLILFAIEKKSFVIFFFRKTFTHLNQTGTFSRYFFFSSYFSSSRFILFPNKCSLRQISFLRFVTIEEKLLIFGGQIYFPCFFPFLVGLTDRMIQTRVIIFHGCVHFLYRWCTMYLDNFCGTNVCGK
jgi:hypothetical protein